MVRYLAAKVASFLRIKKIQEKMFVPYYKLKHRPYANQTCLVYCHTTNDHPEFSFGVNSLVRFFPFR